MQLEKYYLYDTLDKIDIGFIECERETDFWQITLYEDVVPYG